MKSILHKSNTRGHANHGWLNSYHTFSFANYYDPTRTNFGVLRVLNDDVVQGGMGFGKHPHDNMEIVSIPLSGELEHSDTTGRKEVIRTGDVQIMSAGFGIAHAEYNASKTNPVNFFADMGISKVDNIPPRYDQKSFKIEDRINRLQVVVAPDNKDAVLINQDAWFSLGTLKKDFNINYSIKKEGNGVYAFILEGDVTINDQKLNKRDGLAISETDKLSITADSDAEILLIDIPLNA